MRFAVAIVATITFAQAAHAGRGGFLIPPLEFDIGVGAPVGANVDRIAPSTEVLAGVHWASLAWKPTRFDVGVGYVGSFRTIDNPMRLRDDEVRIHGGYLSLSTTIASGNHWRTWLSARGELLRAYHGGRELSALGTSLRIATELFGATATGANKVAIVGTIAIGVFVEATYRDVPDELGALGVTSGISCRLPFMVAGS